MLDFFINTRARNKEPKIYVSFIFAARNDHHCNNFVERFQNSLNILRDLAGKYELNCEILVVEWNPPPNMPRLKEVLVFKDNLNSDVKIITVPNKIHKKIPKTPYDAIKGDEITFFQNIAQNAAIRRASGEYVLCSNGDIIFNKELIAFLTKKNLSDKYFYRIIRYDVQKAIPDGLSNEEALEFCRLNSHSRKNKPEKDRPYREAAGDFFLMAKKNYERIRGFAEIKCDGFKIDGDMSSCAYLFYKQCILNDPLRIYHQYHPDRYERAYDRNFHVKKDYREVYKQSKGLKRILMRRHKKYKNCNSRSWGLIDYSLPEEQVD